jgi:sigma-E factor negative regulatory protein RseC
MIEDIGVVTKTDGVTASIIVQKKGFCDGCAAKGTCESTEEGMEIKALNTVQAKVGQTVKVSLGPQTYLKGTILVYGIPLIAFIGGAIMGKIIALEYLNGTDSDLVAVATGFTVFIISLFGIKIWAKKAASKTEYKPFIEDIVE